MPWKMEIFIDNPEWNFSFDYDDSGFLPDSILPPYKKIRHLEGNFFHHGWEITKEYWPIVLTQEDKKSDYPDLFTGRGAYDMIISKRMKLVIEGLEPSVHNFVPVIIERHDGRKIVDAFYFLNVIDLVDAIDPEKSDVNPNLSRDGRLAYYGASIAANYYFRKDVIRSRHLWVDKYLTRGVFISDRLRKEMMAADLWGVETREIYFA